MDYTKAIQDQANSNIKNGVGVKFAKHAIDMTHPLHKPFVAGTKTTGAADPSPASARPYPPHNEPVFAGTKNSNTVAKVVSGNGD